MNPIVCVLFIFFIWNNYMTHLAKTKHHRHGSLHFNKIFNNHHHHHSQHNHNQYLKNVIAQKQKNIEAFEKRTHAMKHREFHQIISHNHHNNHHENYKNFEKKTSVKKYREFHPNNSHNHHHNHLEKIEKFEKRTSAMKHSKFHKNSQLKLVYKKLIPHGQLKPHENIIFEYSDVEDKDNRKRTCRCICRTKRT